MKKKMNDQQKMELHEQAREARDAEWHAEEGALATKLDAGEIDHDAYWIWLDENPQPSVVAAGQAAERKRLKRKSKKNIKNKIEILDREAMRDMTMKPTMIEWGKGLEEGNLVETRDGDIGMVMTQYDPTHNRVFKPKHIEAAMIGSYVRLLVNGVEEWHTKLSVSPLEDS